MQNPIQSRFVRPLSFSLLLPAMFPVMAQEQTPKKTEASTLTEAFTQGTPNLDIRVRYEGVSQDNKDDASAFTERTRVGYQTLPFHGFSAFVEMSDTASLGSRNDFYVPAGPASGGDADKAVVLDPSYTSLNQAWLKYQFAGNSVTLGKQRIIFDNRYLGNVGWRQNEQVYTGAHLAVTSVPKLKLNYAFIGEVQNPVGVDIEMSSHALQAKYALADWAKLTGYGYWLDYDLAAQTDSRTLGARLTGQLPLAEKMGLSYHLEYGDQSEYADSDNAGGDYTRFDLGLKAGGVKFVVGQETLGGNGDYAYQTPLGTVHLFNGWADQFIGPVGGTPANGLEDRYAKVSGKLAGFKLAAHYHDFNSDTASDHYGSEWNLLAARKIQKNYLVGLKYASYSADDYKVDTQKLWVWGQAKF
ncbi:hypothetical protein [Thiomicrospira sp. WB1]|uniref:hypothetical protein n=1 Tax=Thiomicrospira sp. WB1 TaxID=1685380 RepID=UPI000749738D|nr:hypothetical protein [Thiomicrospira sp. WB1]KUJ72311.1 hypothetical protein AVO41_00385 [Thiomicrospira sp. WB1]